LTSYELSAALADDLYREGKRLFRSNRNPVGLELIDCSGQVGALIARATAFDDAGDIGLHIGLVLVCLDSLEHLVDAAVNERLIAEGTAERVQAIREALREDFPDAVRPRRRPAAPSAGA
jgi:hypothetical protein